MIVTLIGSARFENNFIQANKELALRNISAFSLSAYPRDNGGKDWYTEYEKVILDLVHLNKIRVSRAILLVGDGYFGFSTAREILWSNMLEIPVICEHMYENWDEVAKALYSKNFNSEEIVQAAKKRLIESATQEGN